MLRPDTQKIDVLPCSDLNVRRFKAGTKSHTWFRVSCRWPRAELSLLFPSSLYAHGFPFVAETHSTWKCGESICLPSVPTVPHHVSLWALFHADSGQLWVTRDDVSMKVSSTCVPFISAADEWWFLGIKIHTFKYRPPSSSYKLSF